MVKESASLVLLNMGKTDEASKALKVCRYARLIRFGITTTWMGLRWLMPSMRPRAPCLFFCVVKNSFGTRHEQPWEQALTRTHTPRRDRRSNEVLAT